MTEEDDILPLDRPSGTAQYSEDDIQTLDWKEHLQQRPGMYIGKVGDGTNSDDGIYVLLKEVMDNSIDEFMMGFGRRIIVDVDASSASVRDFRPTARSARVCHRLRRYPSQGFPL